MTWKTKKLGEVYQETKKFFDGDKDPRIIGVLGLLTGSFGAIISALSLTAGDGNQTSIVSGIDYHIALISDIGFKIGFFFLILGFVLQVIEKIHEIKRKSVKIRLLVLIFIPVVFLYSFGVNMISRILFL